RGLSAATGKITSRHRLFQWVTIANAKRPMTNAAANSIERGPALIQASHLGLNTRMDKPITARSSGIPRWLRMTIIIRRNDVRCHWRLGTGAAVQCRGRDDHR